MNKIKNWIRQHQVQAYFVIVYAVAWPGLILVFFIFPGNEIVEVLSMPPVLFCPALAAMLISGIAQPHPKGEPTKSRWVVFIVAWLISAPILILHAWNNLGVELIPATIVFGIMAIFPAWVLSSAFASNPGIRKQFSTLLRPRGPARWYLVIFLVFPGFLLLAFYITRLFSGEVQFYLADLGIEGAALYLFLEFSKGFFLTGGINEESGWRGFALPRLQARYPVLVAGLIVGILWSFWHIPYDIGMGVPTTWILQNRLFWTLLFGILMTWLYNRTNGSLLAPALFHPAMNAFGNHFSHTPLANILFIGLAVYAIVSDRMWEKLPADHLAVYQNPEISIQQKGITQKNLEVSNV
jgi:membrane protease YdiL (CAAX protease family)